jgi:cation diffusion facilitator family transporter
MNKKQAKNCKKSIGKSSNKASSKILKKSKGKSAPILDNHNQLSDNLNKSLSNNPLENNPLNKNNNLKFDEKHNTKATTASFYAILLNLFLFLIKFIVGLMSNSLALISDAFNSLTDIVSSVGIYFAVHFSNKKPDKDHPFGHRRLQPLAAFVVAILTGILGFEIIRAAISNFIAPEIVIVTVLTIVVPIITIIVKGGMAFYYLREGKAQNSPALRAIGVDARNDVFISIIVLAAVISSKYKLLYFDSVVAVIISLFIFYSGYLLAVENMDFLIGKSPPKKDIDNIKSLVKKVNGVTGINDVRAHYVGNFIHIEIHIEVDKNISTLEAHKISKDVQKVVEDLDYVDKAFIHIDPK